MAPLMDLFTGKKVNSAGQAKERLKFVLIHDRTDLTNESLGRMKDEIIQVISRYIDIDENAVQISMAQDGREQRLVADIPLKATRRKKSH